MYEPGFYKYSGGAQKLIFLLRENGQWMSIFDNGEITECDFGYIEQALGAWTLEKI